MLDGRKQAEGATAAGRGQPSARKTALSSNVIYRPPVQNSSKQLEEGGVPSGPVISSSACVKGGEGYRKTGLLEVECEVRRPR